jgi:hypothetical protein
MVEAHKFGDTDFPNIRQNFTGYVLPITMCSIVGDNVCPGCNVKGGPNGHWGGIKTGPVYVDANQWFVCKDCYRDLQREGRIW